MADNRLSLIEEDTRGTAEKVDALADAQVDLVKAGTALENVRQTNIWLQQLCQQLLDIQRRLDGLGLLLAERLPGNPQQVESNDLTSRPK